MTTARKPQHREIPDREKAEIICKYLSGLTVPQIETQMREDTCIPGHSIHRILKANAIPRAHPRLTDDEKMEGMIRLLYSDQPPTCGEIAKRLGMISKTVRDWAEILYEGESDPKIRVEIERVIGRSMPPLQPENMVSLFDSQEEPYNRPVKPRREPPTLVVQPSMSGPGGI